MSGFFPSFARATWFAIGRQGVLSLAGWAPRIQTYFHVSGLTQVPDATVSLRLRGFHPLWPAIPDSSTRVAVACVRSYNPTRSPGWFGLIRFRSPLLTESRFLSFPPGTEMFQFPGLANCTYAFSASQFGNPGFSARLTAPPGFSQSSTPFIASWRQDIPHLPLVAWPH